MQLVMCEYILQWVEDNINSGSGITALATLTGYSRRTIELWFSTQYGISLGSYLFRRRMTRAGVLLKLTNLSITEIALYFHYSSSQNFARAFRNFSGGAPSYYRNTKGWDMSIMQASLLLNKYVVYDKSICYLPDRYLAGKQYFFKDSIVQSDKSENALHIKHIVIDLIKSGKKDIYLSGIGYPSNNMTRSRDGEVMSLTFLGYLVK
ncbi:helix-turn-helix transcriptional regulator [Salmonella enterica subsp. enterica serovar Richmond]|nr:helix-turn-helix transcriptional regulator [Salmonella enterica]EBR9918844.1 AraC family transcriptional regulator [Salmonella enterica subsp. enterica serovar Richmond]EBV8115678.1 AraC family transcriptional regulator [Salmonella enterica subsp. enterica serovar Baildon]EEA9092008.1 helix-turn-helix transcriptional regulator [Salmonella enterica subsp. enterica]EIC4014507.1 helix-turn-helix transcriptional regulator [Salmonella enterica subsp. enterica serovar Amager]